MDGSKQKFLYIDAMCPVDGYFCGMPIIYEQKEDEQFHKVKCYCWHIREGKGQCEDCEHFKTAPDTAGPHDILRDKLLESRF